MSQRRQAASWIADEYGGSYLNNPQQQNRDLAAAHDMAILIQQTVQNKGGDYQRTGELINETLRELSGRAPFGFVTPAFALGTTQVLLDRANQMSGPQFVQYLEGIRDRDNPLFFWERTTLDPLMDEVKDRTRAHVEEMYGRSTFSVFEGMKGRSGPLAFGAGAADAVLEEVGGGGRALILAASNPVEAGRQVVDMTRNLDRLPQALQQQVRGASELIAASGLDDYHKGFLTARVAIIALDAVDVVETGMSLANLSRQLRNGNVDTIGDAMRALDEGPQAMRRSNADSADGGVDATGRTTPQYRATTLRDVGDAAVAGLPPERQPAYRQALEEALQARGITEPERAQRFVADLNGAPEGPTMQGIHRRAGELIYGRPAQTVSDVVNSAVSSMPDNVEWAYQRAMQRTLREQGIDTPEGAQRYMQDLARTPNGAAAQALHQRAYDEVLENAVQALPINAQDYYRRAIDGLARDKGHDSISEVQTYLGNLSGAPNGQSMLAVHNRAYGLLMDDALQSLPANARPVYREALGEILQERGMNNVSDARGYIDRLGGAPNGQSMQALHNRAYDVMLDNTLRNIPESARPAYTQTLGQIFQERGLTTLSAQQTYIDNLVAAPTGPSMQAVHNRAFGTVVDNAVNAMPEAERPAYRQALREQFSASGVDTVAEAQRYVVDLANSPQTMTRLHDRADAILNPSRTPPDAAVPDPARPPNNGTPGTPDNTTPNTNTAPNTDTTPNTNTAPNPNTNTTPGNNGSQPPPPANTPKPDTPEPPPQLRINPASDPDDRLLPYHQRPRSERMDAPDPIEVGGRRYDLVGVTTDGQLRLRPADEVVRNIPSEAMFVNGARNPDGSFQQVGREVSYRGETWRFDALASPGWQPGVTERGFGLVDPNNPERRVFVPADQAGDITMRFTSENAYRLGDVRHGVIRLQPAEPGAEILHRPSPGDRFEARLEGREMEGVKTITVGEDGQLSASGRLRNGIESTQTVQPTDLAPRWRNVDSPDFNDTFQVDSFAHREAVERSRALSTEDTGLPLRDPNFGTQPETVQPRLSLGTGSLDDQAEFIRAQSARIAPGDEARLTVYNIAFNNQGEAQRMLDAMADFRERHPNATIEVVAYRPSFDSFQGNQAEFARLNQFIQDNGADLRFMEGTTSRQVIHAKGVAVNDEVLFTTGAVIDGSRHKADIATPLSPEGGAAFRTYFDEAVLGDASNARRQELAADLARHGVLINDPVARLPYIARAQDGLIQGAERELFIGVSELRNPETTREIIRQLAEKPGLNVEIQYREMDPQSQALLQQAQRDFPDRLQVQNVSNWEPRPHFNAIIADGQQAYVGTAYLWPNQQQMIHHGRSFENGVLLQGESVRQLESQIESLRQLQPAHPGQRLLNPAPDNAPDAGVPTQNPTTGSVQPPPPPPSRTDATQRDVDGETRDGVTPARLPDDIAPTRPQPLRSGDRSYDIVGVNDGERPSLDVVTHNAVPRYVPADALVPRVPGEPHPDARARQVELVATGPQGTTSREQYDIAGVRNDGLVLSRQGENGAEQRFVPYADPNARIEFAFPNGSTYIARQTVDGSVRFDPAESERTRIALEPGMQFEARLRGREGESPYRIEVGADFALSTRSADPARANEPAERIAVSDIAPTWQRVTSTTAPETELFVDSAQYRRAAQRVGREGEPDYPIGTLAGESDVRYGFANQLYRPVLDALRDPATTGDVSIAMYGIGTSREGRQYTDALLDYAKRNPDAQVTIHSADVQINGRRGEALREWLSDQHPNIRISEPLPPSNFNVPHEKIVAVGDQVFIGSEKIGTSMSRKVGFMAEMGAEESRLMHGYIQGLGDARTDPAQTRQTLTALAERGVLIDDPRAGFYPNTAAMNRVMDEAQGHLRIYQSDLIDTVATQRIIDRARDGVQIDLRYRDIDPQSQRMLEQAAGELPNLRFQRVPNDPLHPIYQHENFVISERGGVLSSAYMWEPKAGQVPRYTNGGEGGVLLDAQQAGQYERYLDTAPTRQIGPGAILDLGEEAWNKLSPRLFEQLDRLRPQQREAEPPATQPREQTPPANDGRQSSLPDPVAPAVPASGRGDPGLDDPRNPNYAMFASALDRIQTFERGRGIDSGDFARNLAGDLTVRSVEAGLPRINHVVFNAEGTRAFAVDTPNIDAEWRRVAYTDVATAGQQTLAASSERLRELQPQAQQQMSMQPDAQRPDEQARNAARMA